MSDERYPDTTPHQYGTAPTTPARQTIGVQPPIWQGPQWGVYGGVPRGTLVSDRLAERNVAFKFQPGARAALAAATRRALGW